MKIKALSIKLQLIIFLVCFAAFLAIIDKDAKFLFSTSIAVISAVALESLIIYFREKKLKITDSSVISGLIIGYVLASNQAWWLFLLASFLAIGSKYLIRYKKKHIFNPAAFGIFMTVLLTGAYTQWKGTYIWYILVPFGIYFISKIKKLEIIYGYIIAFLVFFGTQAVIQKVNPVNIILYLSYFYIFIMVVEPKTTPLKPLGKFIFGAGIAASTFLLTQEAVRIDAELLALLFLNLLLPLLNKIPQRRPV